MTTSMPSATGSSEPCAQGNSCVQVDIYDGEYLTEPLVRALATGTDTRMQLRISEWVKFVAEVKNGDWDHVATDYEFAAGRRQAQGMIFEVTAKAPLPAVPAPTLINPFGPIPPLSKLVDQAEHKGR